MFHLAFLSATKMAAARPKTGGLLNGKGGLVDELGGVAEKAGGLADDAGNPLGGHRKLGFQGLCKKSRSLLIFDS
jgi:hypothetical protein